MQNVVLTLVGVACLTISVVGMFRLFNDDDEKYG